ncbi:PKD domain-containing protein [Nocardioides cynanchi]|uniref:PKD domain-containing protein n=1 Tax=Nocardioides cynanchi TaxID=2558918 RepID=UPI001244EE82|nr:PKD domain-containing protein [Nocardioides cynanchi]
MNVASTFRVLAGGLTASLLIGAFGAASAEAKPTRPGGVTNLTGSAAPGPVSGTYLVTSSWDPAASATKYRVALTKGGATLASATITTTTWNPTVTSSPGDASLAVTPVANHRKGSTSRVTVHLADVTAPQGSFTTTWVNATKVATLTEASLTDDSPISQVTRTVDWGDGSPTQSWPAGSGFPTDSLQHTYSSASATTRRFVPTVTLKDAAQNSSSVEAPAVVIDDVTAPTGTFDATPHNAWTAFTTVTVTQATLGDDYSPADHITKSVDWGDGSAPTDWTGATSVTHVYTKAGSFTPMVTLTDEAHNATSPISSSAVTVTTDSAAPVLKLLLPASLHSVRAWKTLRGTANDAGVGVKKVSLRAVEKRGTAWFAYQRTTKTWVKAATKAKAFAKTGALSMTTSASHAWAGKLVGLRKGVLVYKVKATDQVGNTSAALTHKVRLSKR